MAYITQSNYARSLGITPQAISKAIAEGRVIQTRLGIDPDNPSNQYFAQRLKDAPRSKSKIAVKQEQQELKDLAEKQQKVKASALKKKFPLKYLKASVSS